MRQIRNNIVLAAVCLLLAADVQSRSAARVLAEPSASTAEPAYCNVAHNVGRMSLGVSNTGTWATGLAVGSDNVDCFTGALLPSCRFPLDKLTEYCFGAAMWIGAVVGTDTLVSTGADGWAMAGNEFHPDVSPSGNMIYRSTTDHGASFYPGAVSEQDFIALYADTCLDCTGVGIDRIDGRMHRPLNLEVTQSTYAWSYSHADDFVLMDYSIRNIGSQPLQQLYVGYYVDADVYDFASQGAGAQDDLTGFRQLQPATYLPESCPTAYDRVNMAWVADNDGDLSQSPQVYQYTPHVTALRIIRTPSDSLKVSYNWWISNGNPALDYGPTKKTNFRDFGTGGTGTPEGDRNKYFLLSNGECDFDQAFTAAILDTDTTWMAPAPGSAYLYSLGVDTRYLLSFGPFDVAPGQSLPFTLAYVAGADFHRNAGNIDNLPYNPDEWYAGLNFDSLGATATWADWVFDNPGVDTDSDGYYGTFTVCCDGLGPCDTVWLTGDGVPDFRAVSVPPAPQIRVEPRDSALFVRWNGCNSETARELFSRELRFQGYNAYLSTSGEEGTFAHLASYDRDDYFIYRWDSDAYGWRRTEPPISLEDAVCRYAPFGCGDLEWNPLSYTRQTPYQVPGYQDSIMYFEPCLANAGQFGLETPFVKSFPGAPMPPYASPQDVPDDLVDVYLTDDGLYFKYYEYEYLIDNLIPGQNYWVSVTAFDYGSSLPQADPNESDIVGRSVMATPLVDCCVSRVGNADGSGDEAPSIGDIAVMIDAKFIVGSCIDDGPGANIRCLAEADINQDGGEGPTCDDISIGDVSILIDYLFITGPSLGLPECR